jgi:hypothetical protein
MRFFGSLLLAAAILLSFLTPNSVAGAAGDPTLVQIIDTSQWNPPSPDPSGITYWPARNHLVVVDGEVEEMPIFAGANVFQATLAGSLVRTYDISQTNNEPVGIDIDVAPNGHFFISNDSTKQIYDIYLGSDGQFNTGDDVVRQFSTTNFGNTDPEGLTLGAGKLFTVDGGGKEIFSNTAGGDGLFGTADDTVSHFDVESLGVGDPEGVDYNPASGTLYIADRKGKRVFEVTTNGTLVRSIDLRPWGVLNPGDVTLAPGSNNSSETHLYVAARGVDNNTDPNENDGKIYEITLGGTSSDPAPTVSNHTPPSNATNVSVDANVTATFSENVTGVSASSFTLSGPGGAAIAAAVTYDSGSRTATLNPNASLAPGTTYTAQLTTAIKDSANQAISPLAWDFTTAAAATGNLLGNPSFETASSGQPTIWSTNSIFTQSNTVAHAGSFSGKFAAASTSNANATIKQTVKNLAGGTTYQFSAWVNIPTSSDAFTFKLQIKWRNSSNSVLSTTTIATLSDDTAGAWVQQAASPVAPAGTTNAIVQLIANKLSSTIYVDDMSFGP